VLRPVDIVFAGSGVVFIARGLMDFGHPNFSNATTLFDYAAVLGTTLALLGLALGLALLTTEGELQGRARSLVWLPIAGLTMSGTANLLEDAFGVSEVGILFGVGNLLALVGLMATGIASLLDRRNDRIVGLLILGLGLANLLPVTVAWVALGVLCAVLGGYRHRRSARQSA
jgi:hypothetical protein